MSAKSSKVPMRESTSRQGFRLGPVTAKKPESRSSLTESQRQLLERAKVRRLSEEASVDTLAGKSEDEVQTSSVADEMKNVAQGQAEILFDKLTSAKDIVINPDRVREIINSVLGGE